MLGHRSMRKLDLHNHSVLESHKAAKIFAVVDYVKGMTSKNFGKYGEYGLFESFSSSYGFVSLFCCCVRLHVHGGSFILLIQSLFL